MFTLAQIQTFAQEVRKSRFLAMAGPVASEAEAKAFIAAHSDPRATHNCWAWRIGQDYRFHDDGEPGGTAGKPILLAIDGHTLDNTAVLVTRWFGGILLGSGGLMRAYGGTAAKCLDAAAKIPVVVTVEASVACSFRDLPILKARLLAIADVRIAAETFTATGASLVVVLPAADAPAIARMLTDITRGQAQVTMPD
ncbi:MAG: YigZ family protein [Mesorhizobium sp.]|nr:YigZ family protein [Mesorhizobium sp.]